MVSLFGIGNRDFFCKHCGFAVCSSCSQNKKYLSKDAKEKYRVCDLCDTKLDNIKLKLIFERLQYLKDRKLVQLEQLITRMKQDKEKLAKEMEHDLEAQEQEMRKIDAVKQE